MNNLQIREKNIIHTEITRLRGFIFNTERNISVASDETIIEKLTKNMYEKKERILILEKRLHDVESGALNDELEKTVLENMNEIIRKHSATQGRKNQIAEQNKVRSTKARENSDGINGAVREEKLASKDHKYTLKYFDKMCELIPEYLAKDLNEKPNNRGFIWKGIHLYGEKPPADDPTEVELTERISKDMLNIHIWNDIVYEIYSKKHGEIPVKIFHTERRRSIKIPDGITFHKS